MNVYVDNPRLSNMKNGTKALSFVVEQQDPEWGNQVILGFRIMDGFIHPPSNYSRVQRRYFANYFATKETAYKIYQAIIDADWVTEFGIKLLPEKAAVTPLLLTPDVAARVAPQLVENYAETASL